MMPSQTADPLFERAGFMIQPHGHKDMVETAEFNSYGNRFALGGADGRIKVFDQVKDGTWQLCDTWAAHSAEVLEVHWLPPTIYPNLLASIAMDGQFKLWVEDETISPLSGRRFNSRSNRPILHMRSPNRAPYLSFAIKHNPETRHTYLALLDRSSMLFVYENDEPENITNWSEVDRFSVCDKPARGEEASFKVKFDPNLEPSYAAIREGVQRDSLGLIVAGMSTARVWRSKVLSYENTLGSGTGREFYLAADLPGHRMLVRDVAWASGSFRGFDICASVGKDGIVRVFEVHTPSASGTEIQPGVYSKYPTNQVATASRHDASKPGLSGIGAGLATVRSGSDTTRHTDQAQVRHEVREVARLDLHHGPVWRCNFDADGQVLATCGDDGKIITWRRLPDGGWAQNAELTLAKSRPATEDQKHREGSEG